ncbi:MAG: thioredoxin family protein [Rhodospirillales bacterium]
MIKHLRSFALLLIMLVPVTAEATVVNDDGLHTQPWFSESFLILKEDVSDAEANGKRLAVIFEQRGCPYCKEMHEVNFQVPEVSDTIRKHFNVVQLNMWGSREVTDLDGKAMEERELARRWRVNFTPTIVFLPTPDEIAKGETEVARMPGYFKPFHFLSMFEFVHDGSYKDQNFQRYLQDKFKMMEEKGIKPKVW